MSIDPRLKTAPPGETLLRTEVEKQRRRLEAKQILDAERATAERQQAPRLVAFTLSELLREAFPPRKVLLYRGQYPFLRAGDIHQLFAERGLGKTWILETLALVAATGCPALGLRAPHPCRVLYVDGEMSSEEVQERFDRLCHWLKVKSQHDNLVVVGYDWQPTGFLPPLDTIEGQDALEEFVEPADLIILDNRSCLFDPEGEKDAVAWQPAQNYLLSLRRRSKATMLGHHANRQGGARGHSKAEDLMNVVMSLTRPEDYIPSQGASVVVGFTKTRGLQLNAAASFTATLTDHGWDVEDETLTPLEHKLLKSLKAAGVMGERPKNLTEVQKLVEARRGSVMTALNALQEKGRVARDESNRFYVVEMGTEPLEPRVEIPDLF